MIDDFKLTEESIRNADRDDTAKHNYIKNYLEVFFTDKKHVLKEQIQSICRSNPGMKNYNISNDVKTTVTGSCPDNTFGGWENCFSIQWMASFDCKEPFPIAFNFVFRNSDLPTVIPKLCSLTDEKLISGCEFDEKNKSTDKESASGYEVNEKNKSTDKELISGCKFDEKNVLTVFIGSIDQIH